MLELLAKSVMRSCSKVPAINPLSPIMETMIEPASGRTPQFTQVHKERRDQAATSGAVGDSGSST